MIPSILAGLLMATPATAPAPDPGPGPSAKYVFLFVGDGMGLAQVALTEAFRSSQGGDSVGFAPTNFTTFPVLGSVTTHCATRRITESAAAATAMATGKKAGEGNLGLDAHSKPQPALPALCRRAGLGSGLATTVSVDHATPAGFFAQVESRKDYLHIGLQLASAPVDFMGGAGLLQPIGKSGENAWKTLADSGWTVARGRGSLAKASKDRVLALPADTMRADDLPWSLDRRPGDTALGLSDLVREGARILEKNHPNGFFYMVEEGKVDWACHRNDAMAAVGEVLDLDRAVGEALAFAGRHPGEVLILVTADHETGGLALGANATQYNTNFGLLSNQILSAGSMEDSLRTDTSLQGARALSALGRWTGLGRAKGLALDAADSATILAQAGATPPPERARRLVTAALKLRDGKIGVGWTSTAHTAIPVPLYAWGTGSAMFAGRLDNTAVFERIRTVLRLP